MTRHTDIRIRPATEEDIAACAICWGNRRDTYPSIYPLRLADPSITRDKRLGRNARDLSDMLKDPHNMIHVACMHKTGESEPTKIVGYSIWARPEGLERDLSRWEKSKKAPSQDSQSDIQNDSDPECNHELAAKLKEESLLVKRKLFMGKRVWYVVS